ncbi:uncharacterized protein LOC144303181 isoform X4 [Canis aureus]
MASWCCWETAPVVDFPFFTCHHCPEATASTLARGEKSYEYLLCEVLSRCRAFLPMKSLQLQEVKTKRIQYIRERPPEMAITRMKQTHCQLLLPSCPGAWCGQILCWVSGA